MALVTLLSVKDLTINNAERVNSIKYGNVYKGKIIGRNQNRYYVILDNIWVEILVESSCNINCTYEIYLLVCNCALFPVVFVRSESAACCIHR